MDIGNCFYVSPWTAEHVGIGVSGLISVALDDVPVLFFERLPDLLSSSFALGAEVFVFCARSAAALEVSPLSFVVGACVFCVPSADLLTSAFVLEVELSGFCMLSPDLQAASFALEDEPLVFCFCSVALMASFFTLQGRHSLIFASTVLGFQGAAFMMTRSTCLRQKGKGHTRISLPLDVLTIFLLYVSMQ